MAHLEDMIFGALQRLKGGNSRLILRRLNDERNQIFGERIQSQLYFHWIKDDVIMVRCSNGSIASELNFQKELIKKRIKNIIKADFLNKATFDVKFVVGEVRREEKLKEEKKASNNKHLPPREILNRFEDKRIRDTLSSRDDD